MQQTLPPDDESKKTTSGSGGSGPSDTGDVDKLCQTLTSCRTCRRERGCAWCDGDKCRAAAQCAPALTRAECRIALSDLLSASSSMMKTTSTLDGVRVASTSGAAMTPPARNAKGDAIVKQGESVTLAFDAPTLLRSISLSDFEAGVDAGLLEMSDDGVTWGGAAMRRRASPSMMLTTATTSMPNLPPTLFARVSAVTGDFAIEAFVVNEPPANNAIGPASSLGASTSVATFWSPAVIGGIAAGGACCLLCVIVAIVLVVRSKGSSSSSSSSSSHDANSTQLSPMGNSSLPTGVRPQYDQAPRSANSEASSAYGQVRSINVALCCSNDKIVLLTIDAGVACCAVASHACSGRVRAAASSNRRRLLRKRCSRYIYCCQPVTQRCSTFVPTQK